MTDARPLPPDLEDELLAILEADADLRASAFEELCAAHPGDETAIRRWVAEFGSFMLEGASLRAGTKIGQYSIVRLLGEGGFGSVYLAERREPRQNVALKVIKLGMGSEAIVRRFHRELRTLASMEHPNIARVFDTGTTTEGQPYFVMEYIPGVPLTTYCDQKGLSVSERIRLLQSVCAGIEHAHQKTVIHRDLTPRNVLVMDVDGVAMPKVIDFGLAKALEGDEDDDLSTADMRIGTLHYMAPEQAGPHNGQPDTRADVYALGVILYELLTGQVPFDGDALERQHSGGELDPPRPSRRLTPRTPEVAGVAAARHTTIDGLRRVLRNDLDWVALKALERDVERRYASASALAADLQRFLDHQPLLAGPPSTLYRLRKLVRRRRGVLMAAAFVLGTVFLGQSVVSAEKRRVGAQSEAQNQVMLAKAAAKEGKWPDVLTKTGSAQALGYEDHVQLALLRRRAYESLNQPEAAAQCLEQIGPPADLGDYLPVVLLEQATACLAGDAKEARRLAEEAISYQSSAGGGLSAADGLYAQALLADSVELAKACLDGALEDAPDHYRARGALLPLLFATGAYEEAYQFAAKWAVLFPGSPEPLALRTMATLLQGHFAEGTALNERLALLDPASANVITAATGNLRNIDEVAALWSRQSLCVVARIMLGPLPQELALTPPPDLGQVSVDLRLFLDTTHGGAFPRMPKPIKDLDTLGVSVGPMPMLAVLSSYYIPLPGLAARQRLSYRTDRLLALTMAVASPAKVRLDRMRAARQVRGLTSELPGLRRLELTLAISYAVGDRFIWRRDGALGEDIYSDNIAADALELMDRPGITEDELHCLAVLLFATEPKARWEWADRVAFAWEKRFGRTQRFLHFRAEMLLVRGQVQEAVQIMEAVVEDGPETAALMARIRAVDGK